MKKRIAAWLCILVLLFAALPVRADSIVAHTFREVDEAMKQLVAGQGKTKVEFYTGSKFSDKVGREKMSKTISSLLTRWLSANTTIYYRNHGPFGMGFWIDDYRSIRPAIRMAEAWKRGNTKGLSKAEKKCLKQVVKVVDRIKKRAPSGSLKMEMQIFDWVCNHMSYRDYPNSDPHAARNKTAVGAFNAGRGNCQAYSELFYLMAVIGGLEVTFVSGYSDGDTDGPGHMWNAVKWKDEWYMVDCTWGDDKSGPNHKYLNFGLDRARKLYDWSKQKNPLTFAKKTVRKYSH